ncbi:Conserved_hypothetical protein [Hexamita inflata]|uniref:Uncharacterized protein n=1 Tax=Hexamita inflata TaxID=28002 RepID=A0AA86U1J0_9EUKA|nr:Conserved hypothetical protein [Hexamita inflata]
MTCSNSSGLVNIVNQQINLTIVDCKLSGSNFNESSYSGFIVSQIQQDFLSYQINNLFVCVSNIPALGNQSILIQFNLKLECDLCGELHVVYGICQVDLLNGQLVDGILQCIYPFIFDNNQCICDQGYMLDQLNCVNIIQAIQNISNIDSQMQQRVIKVENAISELDQSILFNSSFLLQQLYSTQSVLESYILSNHSLTLAVLDNRIYGNATILSNYINTIQINLENYILQNLTILDWRIYNNISELNQNISRLENVVQYNLSALQQNFTNTIATLNLSINDFKFNQSQIIADIQTQYQNQVIQMQDIITNMSKQINCTNAAGTFINGSCVQNSCSIQGQKLINGVCQCANVNAFVENNVCVCPKYSMLVGSVCTCPDNASVDQGICTCLTTGQTIQSGVCQCSTTYAFVKNGTCTCGIDSLNTSNTCSCPENSNLINGTCTCNITGQTMQSGVCTCPSGQPVVSGSCQIVVIINSTDNTFQCNLDISITTFDIQTATNQLTTPLSFSQFQIFAASEVISDAFIDISDNVYSTLNPLFQSQNSFTNIKIQIATQMMANGSILVPNTTTTLKINKMSIISKNGSSITVSQNLNILIAYSSDTDICTLLVNLNFSMSSGSIALINTVSSIYITSYQILGTIQSSNQVSMIALLVASATSIINQVSFKTTVFNVGNCSSYLFGTAASSQLTVSNIVVIIGNSSSLQVLTQISVGANYWQFGGIIANILGSSQININNVISDCYQQINPFTQLFGFLVGYGQQNSSSLTITNVCQQQKITSSQQFYYFGLIGLTLTNTTLTKVNTRILIYSNSGYYVGIMFGALNALNSSISNINVVNCILSSQYYMGGLIGFLMQSNLLIQNSTISRSNLSGPSYVGGLIGVSQGSVVKTSSSKVQSIRITAASHIGIVVGFNNGNTFTFSNSSSIFFQINNVLQFDCPQFSNALSRTGC